MPDQIAKRRARRTTVRSHRPFAEWAWVSLLLISLAGISGWQNGLNHFELAFFDQVLSSEAREPNAEIAIIAIDDISIARFGAWPFPREVQAKFFAQINQAHVRALGVVSALGEDAATKSDSATLPDIAALISANKHVALNSGPYGSQTDRNGVATPASLLAAAAAVGTEQQVFDVDGVVRRVALTSNVGGRANPAPNFVIAVLEAAQMDIDLPGRRATDVDGGPSGTGDHWVLIPYSGGPGHYPSLSYADVVAGHVPAEALAGKLVLVGRIQRNITARRVPTSFWAGFGNASMAPVEVDANLLAGLLEQRTITPLLPLTNALGCMAPVMLAMALLYLRVRRAVILTALIAAVVVLTSIVMMPLAGLWFAPGGALVGLALALPFWRWRQLEGDAMRADAIVARLEASPDHYAEATSPVVEVGLTRVEQRIQALSRTVYRVSELRFFIDHMIEALPHSVLVTNADGHIVAANRQARNYFASLGNTRLDGAQLPYLLGLMTLEGGAGGRSWWDIMDLSVATPKARARDVRNRDLLVRAAAWHGVNGEIGGWFATIEDVSSMRTLERRRNDALQFLGETVGATHRTITEALESEARLDPVALEHAREKILSSSREALGMTEKFIELSNAESRDYAFAVSDVCDAIELAVDGAFSQAGALSIVLQVRKPDLPLLADIDMLMLSRALSVLIGNGLRFSSQGQQVEIAVEEQGGEAVFSVIDHGRGIAPLQQARMMRSLQPVHSASATTRATGFGLGLSFVRTVTEKHHGRVEFNSNPGQGSTFRIVLPALRAETNEGLSETAAL